jgi:ribose 5-phosphate isomerase B
MTRIASGQVEQIVANEVRGVRAALGHDPCAARLAAAHDDANAQWTVGPVLGTDLADDIVTPSRSTPFDDGRHDRRARGTTALEADL